MPPKPHPEAESNLRAAERVAFLLAEHGVSAVVIGEALASEVVPIRPGSGQRLVPLAQLVALKL